MCKCSSETISLQLEQSHSGPSCNIQQSSDNLGLSLSSLKCQTGAHQITQPFTSARQLIKRQIWAGRVNIKAYCLVIAHGGYQPGDLLTFLPVCSHFPAYSLVSRDEHLVATNFVKYRKYTNSGGKFCICDYLYL